MLRIAIPNKGSLAEESISILKEAGYRQRSDARDLVLVDRVNSVEFYYLRPRDIALYVGSGDLEAGITGRDLLIDSQASAEEVLPLHYGASTFHFAAPAGKRFTLESLTGLRVATAYPGLLSRYLQDHGLSAEVVRLDGAVESSVRLGVADVIADVVSTGNTLRQAGLELFGDPILVSEAILIKRSGASMAREFEVLLRRVQGVVTARQYVLLDYDVSSDKLEEACTITPGLESPTISPLAKEGWVAVRAMVRRTETNQVMDQLWELGARGILVTDIHACRL